MPRMPRTADMDQKVVRGFIGRVTEERQAAQQPTLRKPAVSKRPKTEKLTEDEATILG